MVNTIADHNLLYQLAVKHDGQMINVDQMEDFPRLLKERQDIKTITYSEKRYLELVNVFWIFLIILAVLATEWFIRKFNGSY
jgi:ribonuclease HIII